MTALFRILPSGEIINLNIIARVVPKPPKGEVVVYFATASTIDGLPHPFTTVTYKGADAPALITYIETYQTPGE